LIKLFDGLHNIQTIEVKTPEKKEKVVEQRKVVIPMEEDIYTPLLRNVNWLRNAKLSFLTKLGLVPIGNILYVQAN
jgi:hypothetical protein